MMAGLTVMHGVVATRRAVSIVSSYAAGLREAQGNSHIHRLSCEDSDGLGQLCRGEGPMVLWGRMNAVESGSTQATPAQPSPDA